MRFIVSLFSLLDYVRVMLLTGGRECVRRGNGRTENFAEVRTYRSFLLIGPLFSVIVLRVIRIGGR